MASPSTSVPVLGTEIKCTELAVAWWKTQWWQSSHPMQAWSEAFLRRHPLVWLPAAMAPLHVLCSLPCLHISIDLWPLQSSLTAAQLLAQTLHACAPGLLGREAFGERPKPPMQ